MRLLSLLFTMVAALYACRQPRPKVGDQVLPYSEKNTTIGHTKFVDKFSTAIFGTWAIVGEENATFIVENDSITYPETFTSYKYTIEKDSIKINFDDYFGSYHISMIGDDTLVLTGGDEQIYYRFTN